LGEGDALKKCDLGLSAEYRFARVENFPSVPVVDILIFHEDMGKSLSTKAIIDTGFDESLILSREVRDAIYKFVDPYDHESLEAGTFEIPCELYALKLRIGKKWLDIVAHAPIIGDYDTLIGRKVTNTLNLCLRAPKEKTYIALEHSPD
jgi:predicted aspartyl protease